MICQNCQAQVDDDLIFCTNCGARLINSKGEAQTVLINEPTVTKPVGVSPMISEPTVLKPTVNAPTPKPASNLKWVALIVALIAIPASIFGVYLLIKPSNNQQTAQTANKPKSPSPTATRKVTNDQNSNANVSNVNPANTNANANSVKPKEKIEVMNERIEIAPKEHYAVPFELGKDNTKLVGEAKLLEGEKIAGFVYLQKSYDDYFPDPTYKMFSFEGKKTADINATLVEEKYVLIFVNDTDKPLVIQGNFSVE